MPRVSMKLQTPIVQLSYLLLLSFFITSCVPDKGENDSELPDAPPAPVEMIEEQTQLPVQYQQPTYMVDTSTDENIEEIVDDVSLKSRCFNSFNPGASTSMGYTETTGSIKKDERFLGQ